MTETRAELEEFAERIARESRYECARCDHTKKMHCAGNQVHSSPKEAQAMTGRNSTVCVGRHCLHPLCSCTEFVTAWSAGWAQREPATELSRRQYANR